MPTLNARRSTLNRLPLRSGSRIGRCVALVGLATAVLAVTGCGQSTTVVDSPESGRSELSEAGGRPCPTKLPIGEDPSGHGFGTEEVAEEFPILLELQEAWVCQYNTFDVSHTANGGTVFGWRRAGQPRPVAAADLADLQDALDGGAAILDVLGVGRTN